MPMEKHRYPDNWREIATAVKDAAGWKCQQCGNQCRKSEDCSTENLMAMCAPCHLRYDASHHAETRKRRRNAENAQRATDAHKTPKDGHSGHENRECGEI